MKAILTAVRIIVGVLFIFSGLIKANDPLGLSYKMQEFFEVWNLHALNDFTLAFSILMIAFEIIAGVAVILGWQMKLFSWLLLLLIIFFTFLTGYALFSGKIRTCGCFGDCIPLTADQSFIKDLVLLVLIIVIFANRRKISPSFSAGNSLGILLAVTAFSFGIQWYVLKHLPILDCLPYKKGKNLALQMQVPPGSIPDSTVINFVYNKQGKQVEFTAETFPEDFDDSLYQFVRRYDKLVRKGNAEPPIKDFSLTTASGNDTTQAILASESAIGLIFIKDQFPDDSSWVNEFRSLVRQAAHPFFVVTNASDQEIGRSAGFNSLSLPILKCDAVAIKTAARANPTVYILKKGVVQGKWSAANLDIAQKSVRP